MKNSSEVRTWADVMYTPEKRTVKEDIAKSLKERDYDEKKSIWTTWIKAV